MDALEEAVRAPVQFEPSQCVRCSAWLSSTNPDILCRPCRKSFIEKAVAGVLWNSRGEAGLKARYCERCGRELKKDNLRALCGECKGSWRG